MTIFLTLGVVIAALVCFITEWLPVDITAFCVAVVLIILGLVTPEERVAGFSNSATITIMAMFILSAAIARTGVIQVFRDLLLKWGGKSISRQIWSSNKKSQKPFVGIKPGLRSLLFSPWFYWRLSISYQLWLVLYWE